jgi:hypothetical protein
MLMSELVHDPTMGVSMQLRPCDAVVFDNKRLLHSRSAVIASDGERHVQGCYMDGDGVLKLNDEHLRRVANDQQHNETDGSGAPASAWHALPDTTKEDTIAMGDNVTGHGTIAAGNLSCTAGRLDGARVGADTDASAAGWRTGRGGCGVIVARCHCSDCS